MKPIRTLALIAVACVLQACGGESGTDGSTAPAAGPQRSPSPPGATVFIIEPINGATVSSPVTVKFGISGMEVMPAGTIRPYAGHHHLLVDTELSDPSLPMPSSENHLHFGKGQTETALELAPGQHTLQLVLGDAAHIPHDPPVVSAVVAITVE